VAGAHSLGGPEDAAALAPIGARTHRNLIIMVIASFKRGTRLKLPAYEFTKGRHGRMLVTPS
jgi:hypothetical protein